MSETNAQATREDLEREVRVLRGLEEMGAILYYSQDQEDMFDTVLYQARHLSGAQAGSLFLVWKGQLRFVAVQNDKVDTTEIADRLIGKEVPVSPESLAGLVALSGEIMNIPDSFDLPPGTPFRINRDLDAHTGYRTQSILAIPLKGPDDSCVGVLQLLNHLEEDGSVSPFPKNSTSGILTLASAAAISVHNATLQEQLRQAHLNTIFRLSTVAEYRDDDTSQHIRRVSCTSEIIAEQLGLDADEMELIKYASPMHDVGKVAIPDSILLKPGHLTDTQRSEMQKHTTIGAEILSDPEDDVVAMARDIALSHHERWDGKGYPRQLKEEQSPQCARIVALADVFDALVSSRCYKAACSLDAALAIVQEDRGAHFAPDVADAFLAALDRVLKNYPHLTPDQ